jgi:hypothetical protein
MFNFVDVFDRSEYDTAKLIRKNFNHVVQVYFCQELETKIVFVLEYCSRGV